MPRAAAAGLVPGARGDRSVRARYRDRRDRLAGRSDLENAKAAAEKTEGWLNDLGVDKSGSSSAKSSVEADVPKIISTLTKGVINGIEGLTSLAFALSFALLSVFFIMKDGPSMRRWVDRHLGVPLRWGS
jgi:predicted PurR-regulated permease PerM